MKSQYLLLSASATVAIVAMSAIALSPTLASNPTFSCQSNQGTPTTVVENSSGDRQPVFHWKLDRATVSNTPEELCNSVTQKLNTYMSEGNDFSSLTFKSSTVLSEGQDMTIPAICVAGEDAPCKLLLFTLNSSDDPQFTASNALKSVLDPALQANPVRPTDRGVQSTSYQVNFWELLGF